MIRAILSGALLAAAATATVLPTTERFTAPDYRGTFTSRIRDADFCPQKIFHESVISGGNAVAHNAITVDGASCQNNGNMALFPLSANDKVSTALSAFTGKDRTLADNSVAAARMVNGSYMGVATVPRICGAKTFPANTIFIFSVTDKDFDTGINAMPPFKAFVRVMVSMEPGASYVCPYSAKPRPSPSPSPAAIAPGETPAPVEVTPAPATEVPAEGAGATGGAGAAGESGVVAESPAPDGGSVCFPGDATVELADGQLKAMGELELGDVVRVSGGQHSPVFMFTHKLANVAHPMVALTTASGSTITMTRGHYVWANGGMRPASAVAVGDRLRLADGTLSDVSSIKAVAGRGLYNPQTVEGSIVVNGVEASTYTTAVEMTTAHGMLAPLRAAFGWLGLTLSVLESGFDGAARNLPSGFAVY